MAENKEDTQRSFRDLLSWQNLTRVGMAVLFAWTLWDVSSRTPKTPEGFIRYHKDSTYTAMSLLGGSDSPEKPLLVIRFQGDLQASAGNNFSKLIDEAVVNKNRIRGVALVLNSAGGGVSEYGFVYSQVERLRKAEIDTTACIDLYAASGGYLSVLPANKILAAPYSLVGSVGVVAIIPNARKFLEDHGINPRIFTAGKNKVPISYFDKGDAESEATFREQLAVIHRQFLASVKKYRPHAKMKEVQEADAWTAEESLRLELGLVDEIGDSRSFLLEENRRSDLVEVKTAEEWTFLKAIGGTSAARDIFSALLSQITEPRF